MTNFASGCIDFYMKTIIKISTIQKNMHCMVHGLFDNFWYKNLKLIDINF